MGFGYWKRKQNKTRTSGKLKGKRKMNLCQRGKGFGLAASVLTPIAIEVIGTSITKKKPVTKVMRDYFK